MVNIRRFGDIKFRDKFMITESFKIEIIDRNVEIVVMDDDVIK